MLDIIGGILDARGVLDLLGILIKPWCFVLSARYRKKVIAGWKNGSPSRAMVQKIGGALVIMLTVALGSALAALSLRTR